MKRALYHIVGLACLCLTTALLADDTEGLKLDREIAERTAVIANNRLVKNRDDEHAFLMLQMALRVDSECTTAHRIMNMIADGKKPEKLRTRITEKKLYQVMGRRADELSKLERHLNLACLYYRMIEKGDPNSKPAIVGLQRLAQKHKVEPKLTELLGTVKLYDKLILPEPKPRPPVIEEPEKPEPGPLLPNDIPAGWSVCLFEKGRWNHYPLSKITHQRSDTLLTVTNTTGVGTKALLVYGHLYQRDFGAQVVMKGGNAVGMIPNDGTDRPCNVKVRKKGWIRYRIYRNKGKYRCWEDGKKVYIKSDRDLANVPMVLCVEVLKGETVEIRL